jgi:two-component system, NtrC family, response regulator GlrR
MTGTKILVLDSEPSSDIAMDLQEILEESLPGAACIIRTETAPGSDESAETHRLLKDFDPDLVFVSICKGTDAANKTVGRVHRRAPGLPVIMLGDVRHPDEMLALLKEGAVDFITPPFKAVDIVPRVRRCLETEFERPTVRIKATLGLKNLVGQNQAFVAEITKIPVIARCDATVLITGETGTGKELCARAIHYLSSRAKRPFIPINCGAIPAELAENELFGHERGAYTGAASSHPGIIEEANCGTLFLDEIDCLSPLTQVKLLRFLQDKEYRPLGASRTRQADVRIIAATNTDIEESVRQGRVRQDLYYRLHVIPFALVPLRERADDIPLLGGHFLSVYAGILKKRVTDISTGALSKLMLYQWPGNVRELEHVIERAVVMCKGPILAEEDITLSRFEEPAAHCSFQEGKARAVSQFERNYIKGLLITYRGNITRAAKAANKNRRAFWELIRKHRIDVSVFRQGVTR